MNKELNKIYNEITNDIDEKMKRDDNLEKEAEKGKRHFWIVKDNYGLLCLYPEGAYCDRTYL